MVAPMCAREAVADDAVFECWYGEDAGRVRLTAKRDDGGCAGFEVRTLHGRLIQAYKGWLGSGTLISTPDGARVVFVHSYPFASVGADGRVHNSEPSQDRTDGVVIFANGKRLVSYEINDLIARRGMVQITSSHLLWLRGARLTLVPTPRLTLNTTSFRRLTFELSSGKLMVAEDSPEWTKCPVIARGRIVATNEGLELIDVAFAKGKASSPVRLVARGERTTPGVHTLCLRPADNRMTVVDEFPDVGMNTLRVRAAH
jgi:hypothetical protein